MGIKYTFKLKQERPSRHKSTIKTKTKHWLYQIDVITNTVHEDATAKWQIHGLPIVFATKEMKLDKYYERFFCVELPQLPDDPLFYTLSWLEWQCDDFKVITLLNEHKLREKYVVALNPVVSGEAWRRLRHQIKTIWKMEKLYDEKHGKLDTGDHLQTTKKESKKNSQPQRPWALQRRKTA